MIDGFNFRRKIIIKIKKIVSEEKILGKYIIEGRKGGIWIWICQTA